MQRLCLLCGAPGSGKTTVLENMKRQGDNAVAFVIFDEIQEEIAGREFTAENWHTAQHGMRAIVEGLMGTRSKADIPKPFLQILVRIWPFETPPLVIVAEDNFYYKSMRACFRRIAIESKAAFLCWYMKCSAKVCHERHKARTERYSVKVPKETIDKMLELANWEGADEIDSEKFSAAEICEKVMTEYSSPSLSQAVDLQKLSQEQLHQSQQQTLTNVPHQLDLALRKATSAFLSSVPSSFRSVLGKSITSSKKAALNSAKNLVSVDGIDEVAEGYTVTLWKLFSEVAVDADSN